MKNVVRNAYTREVVFEGSNSACEKWILDQAECYDGRRFYRTWTQHGDTYWDVGRVYIFNK